MTDLCHRKPADSKQIVLDDAERQRCEIWTRVMGYHRPLSSFNIGKKGEFHERKYFSEQCAQLDG
ncbi:anaerobic ribonucleoside-triphosphate reductase [Noviherbaspirillum sp.]|uniref:anaerobic ribonucleoside-triphosphate reductase n=1 Tax=Noviherbaspirillum sp. TaxID=1926288 RepID=UPI0039C8E3E0